MIELTADQAERMLKSDRIRDVDILTVSPGSDIAAGLLVGIGNDNGQIRHLRITAETDAQELPVLTFRTYD